MPEINESARDSGIIEGILAYCREIETTHDEFDRSKERFAASKTYQNAIAMCILQIGELSKRLSEPFIQANQQIPWKDIARARDAFAHHYGHTDADILWDTATKDIVALREFCESYLNK